ncbi:MAG TPA: FxLYD domain-containing protein [Hyphomicrobiales bacterium]|nr:FxLYD domain-containing protein [Hyphomicrobiales bacterium]
MTTGQDKPKRWSSWTLEIKVWKILAVLVILPILVLWLMIVHQNDEILALIRNEVMTDAAGQRTWVGSFVNTNDRTLRDVAVTVNFLDSQDRPIGKAEAEADELPSGTRLDLEAPLPPEAVRLRIYSVQWRKDRTAALMGPFREPWEFGYLMVDPTENGR